MSPSYDMYEVEVRHDRLNKYRHISGRDRRVVEEKARAQRTAWDEMWEKRQEAERRRAERENMAQEKEEKKALAAERTREAHEAIAGIEGTLQKGLETAGPIKWKALKDKSLFAEPEPLKPDKLETPRKPLPTDVKYQPKSSFLDLIWPSRKERKAQESATKFKRDFDLWRDEIEALKKRAAALVREYRSDFARWREENEVFLKHQRERNAAIDTLRDEYQAGTPAAIVEYCDMVLANLKYPDTFPQQFQLDYIPETRILLVDYSLPSTDDIPKLKEVKYVQSRDAFTEVKLTGSAFNKLYDSLLYQVALRSVHELYQADAVEALESIVFNGWVNSVDKGTGQEVNACILSLQASREEFSALNLAQVESKTCFKTLKGVGSSKLHSLSPVAPIMKLDREDKRFVSSYEVADGLDDSYNIAAMDWEDFEHLIRELFEKEFTQGGGEVKVTQASRDGGVDAVAFDPDPIRGGKIVIQAKRYTNTVSVAAVRDLYGTVVNEGATKGILVSTADYGPDAYEFAKGKPLTLLNGGNLLHLLEKHGHKAKIDLKEAKQILAEREKGT